MAAGLLLVWTPTPIRQAMGLPLASGSMPAMIRSWAERLIPAAGAVTAITLIVLVRRHALLLTWSPSAGPSGKASSPLADILLGIAAFGFGVAFARLLPSATPKHVPT
ncbi:MAG TPA: hypothetical protein VG815_17815 [Chloroflexota bacterium]|jgi:hypothetical protein|nr:hypothetical protein [Chloroflexota bacterium]